MIEGECAGGVIPAKLHPQILRRFPKYPPSVEQHLKLAELRPGHFEYTLEDYLVKEQRYAALITIPLEVAVLLAPELRKSRTPPRRRSTR